ncbi:perlucin [Elysia marginata]|uniref:Perlucin n=1 Tax=Elysia marginata TaxID=1093978 RepID=A0AAV4J3Z4_9GAST|nr:perlucin [Elysia marginata]
MMNLCLSLQRCFSVVAMNIRFAPGVEHADHKELNTLVLCESMDANLVEINDPMKEHFLFTTILQKESRNAESPMWIGASDMLTENSWVWVKSKRHMTFRNWKMRLVDALKEGHGHCLALQTLPQFEWKEVKCSERHGFICEFDPMLY